MGLVTGLAVVGALAAFNAGFVDVERRDPVALAALVRDLDDPLSNSADEIARFGSAGATALARELVRKNASSLVQHHAAQGLAHDRFKDADVVVDVSEAVDILRRALPHADERLDLILAALGHFGDRASAAIDDVRALRTTIAPGEQRQRTTTFAHGSTVTTVLPDLDQLLLQIGDDDAVIPVARQIPTHPYAPMRLLAARGPRAAAAVPLLLDIVAHGDQALQARAAYTLGEIGDPSASAALIAALDSTSWRVVLDATHALGRIGIDAGPAARAHLETLRDQHWSAVVRGMADVAVRLVVGEHVDDPDVWYLETRDHHGFACAGMRRVGGERWHEPEVQLAERWSTLSTTVDDGTDTRLMSDTTITAALPALNITPVVFTLPVDDGVLVARDAGEWGGDLHHVGNDGRVVKLIDDNTWRLRRIGNDIFAFTGLVHLVLNNGALFRIRRDDEKGWQAAHVVELPGAPMVVRGGPSSRTLLVVAFPAQGLVVEVDAAIDDVIRPLPCRLP